MIGIYIYRLEQCNLARGTNLGSFESSPPPTAWKLYFGQKGPTTVVYFNQQMGASHADCWLKSSFSITNGKRRESTKKKEKILTKKTKREVFMCYF